MSRQPRTGRAVSEAQHHDVRRLLDEVRRFVRRFVVLNESQADVIALWVLHTHAIAAAETTPYLEISSAEKESGKTRLLETLEFLVARPWLTGRTSISALARKVDAEQPTLLLDESDAALASDKTYVQELRGILNSGFRRGSKYTINVSSGQNGWTPTDFFVFCPKAIAGIGSLPDTVVSRSITIRLERRRPGERVEKFRFRRVKALAEPLRARLELVLPPVVEALIDITEADPAMPPGLSDRAEDVWEPLVAIADLAGGDWPERTHRAAVELGGKRRDEEDSIRVQLLRDIRSILHERGLSEITSSELVLTLNAIEESPWGGWAGGKGLTPHSLAKQLRPFSIAPGHTRDGSARGYSEDQFDEVFSRYLPALIDASVKPSEAAAPGQDQEITDRQRDGSPDGSEGPPAAPEDGSDVLTVPSADTPAGALGRSREATTTDEYTEDRADADAEYERLHEKFPDLFRSDP
jgi:hypothetical protein